MLNKKAYVVVFMFIFAIELVIGLLSNVSLTASLARAFLDSIFFTGLLWGFIKFIRNYVIHDVIKELETKEDDQTEKQIDITVTDDNISISDLYDNPSDSHGQVAATKDNDKEFTSLTSQQIDPQVSKIINDNPERLAQIVRKMGFEDES